MLYYLSEYENVLGPLRIFEYITVRTMGAAGTAFILSMIFGPRVIELLRKLNIGQNVRDDDVLAMHRSKQGTPTMGGILIITAVLIATVAWAKPSVHAYLTLSTLVWMGLIGFWDDYLKVVKKQSKGLNAKSKLLLQTVWMAVVFFVLWNNDSTRPFTTQLMVPFLKEPIFHSMPIVITVIFMYLVLVGTCNAVNLTDGMDGLAIGCSNATWLAYVVMAYATGNIVFAEYLNIPNIPGTGELAVFGGAMLGAGLGFLWWNCHPAKIFMGDTGSLAIGGSLAMVAILIKQELTLIIVGGVFVMESASVVLQVARFKLTGKRFFRCAPIHHHFEIVAKENAVKEGRPDASIENLVVTRMWIMAIIFAILGVATLKLR